MKKNSSNKRKIEHRLRRIRFILNSLAFDLTTPSPDADFAVSTVGLSDGDRIHFRINFSPTLDKEYATSSTVSVTHFPSKRQDTVIVVLPKTEDKKGVSYGTNYDYLEFCTHTVKIEQSVVSVLYLTLNNVQMRGDIDVPIWKPEFNFGLGYFPRTFEGKYEPLCFYPPDVNFGGVVDLACIPQKYSLVSFKPTGGITGSKVAKLIGYYISPTFQSQEQFTGWSAVNVRFGREGEDTLKLIHLLNHPEFTKMKEVGYLTINQEVRESDGSEPDLIVQDEKGIPFPVEYKYSRSNSTIYGNHIAQCIWEMASGPTFPQCHLVRGCQRQVQVGTNQWTTVMEAKEIKLFRSEEREKELIRLCVNALKVYNNREYPKFLELMETQPYKEFREYLDKLADESNQKATKLEIREEIIKEMNDYRQHILDKQEEDVLTTHPIMDRIEKRQARVFASFQEENKDGFMREVCEQIEDYAELIKSNFY
jgi:hypothetical protein